MVVVVRFVAGVGVACECVNYSTSTYSLQGSFMNEGLSKQTHEIRDEFLKLYNRDDISRLLGVTTKQLNFHLYVLPTEKKYKTFSVPKKSGGTRKISAPASPIKVIQQSLREILEVVYKPKPATHGFVPKRSIITNSRLHKKRRYVLNIDLENFFPTIHFGRVRGMFMGNPYKLNNEVATILAQICCHEGVLPQGAPTSPIVSNMICARLDAKLQQLAKEHQCTYSRYADDITFSTNRSKFPFALAYLSDIGQVEIGDELSSTIMENGFKINLNKIRLQVRQQRQEVTGLTVNKYPNVHKRYVKQVRAMLHAWNKFTLESTAQNYFENYASHKYSDPQSYRPSLQEIILGKIQFIGMVKGRRSPVYLGLLRKFSKLAPEYFDPSRLMDLSLTQPFIYTEGKTDRKHLEAALRDLKLQGLFMNLNMEFAEKDLTEGADRLLQKLNNYREHLEVHARPHIFIFDRDRLDIFQKIKGNDEFTSWGNNVYSFAIPIPKHREGLQRICIEFCYNDKDITRVDENGRRIFINTEFDSTTGEHLSVPELQCKNIEILHGEPKILDNWVENSKGEKIALSKNSFANNVLNQIEGFMNIDFSGFKSLFGRIQLIINDFDSENN
jgi:RNA-directed DNA polymerase